MWPTSGECGENTSHDRQAIVASSKRGLQPSGHLDCGHHQDGYFRREVTDDAQDPLESCSGLPACDRLPWGSRGSGSGSRPIADEEPSGHTGEVGATTSTEGQLMGARRHDLRSCKRTAQKPDCPWPRSDVADAENGATGRESKPPFSNAVPDDGNQSSGRVCRCPRQPVVAAPPSRDLISINGRCRR